MLSIQIYFFIKLIPVQEIKTFPLSSEGIILCPCHFLPKENSYVQYPLNISEYS